MFEDSFRNSTERQHPSHVIAPNQLWGSRVVDGCGYVLAMDDALVVGRYTPDPSGEPVTKAISQNRTTAAISVGEAVWRLRSGRGMEGLLVPRQSAEAVRRAAAIAGGEGGGAIDDSVVFAAVAHAAAVAADAGVTRRAAFVPPPVPRGTEGGGDGEGPQPSASTGAPRAYKAAPEPPLTASALAARARAARLPPFSGPALQAESTARLVRRPGAHSPASLLFDVSYNWPKTKVPSSEPAPLEINNADHARWPPLQFPYPSGANFDPATAAACIVGPLPIAGMAPPPLVEQAGAEVRAPLTVRMRASDPDSLPLYRIGPGAVAFRVVMNAFEAGAMVYTPGGCTDARDYRVPGPVEPWAAEDDWEDEEEEEEEDDDAAMPGHRLRHRSTAASWNILWAKRCDPIVLSRMNPYQRINHFPGSWALGRKDNLHRYVQRMQRIFGVENYDIVPRSFLYPEEADALRADAAGRDTVGTYIVKPCASSCGNGIRVVRGLPTFPAPGPSGKQRHYVVQQYLEPFLVAHRKFDLRLYCVITGVNPLRVWLFDEGLGRFAAEPYPGAGESLENTHMHLTNYSVNKTGSGTKISPAEAAATLAAGTDAPINIKWTLTELRRFVVDGTVPPHSPSAASAEAGRGRLTETQWRAVMSDIEAVVIKAILSVEQIVVADCKAQCRDPTGRGCFELFGMDVMLDANLKASLIEVNIMPSLATNEASDKAVKARMLAHMLTLVGAAPFSRASERASPTPAVGAFDVQLEAAGAYHYSGRAAALGPPPEALRDPRRDEVGLLQAFGIGTTITAAEALMLDECEDELYRAGGFRRIFPTPHTHALYSHLFAGGLTRNNYVLASWEAAKARRQ